MNEHIGPSLWHSREINSCTRCKYLKCRLVKSGRHPDYDYFCIHPSALAGEVVSDQQKRMLEKIRERLPHRVEYFEQKFKEENAARSQQGEFICNDEVTPETPQWCPVTNAKKV